MALEWAEIPSGNRGLGNCGECKQKNYCSWACNNGRKYCETCKFKLEAEGDKPEPVKVVEAGIMEILENDLVPIASELPMFALNPIRSINLSIGKLSTGWVLAMEGQNHVFTSKDKLLKAINAEMSVEPELDTGNTLFHGPGLKERLKNFDIEKVVGE